MFTVGRRVPREPAGENSSVPAHPVRVPALSGTTQVL